MSDNKKNMFITWVMVCFITLDFLRMSIANLYKIYDFSLVIFAMFSLLFTALNFRKIKDSKFFLMILLFVGYISLSEFLHSGFNNLNIICENIIWTLLPLNFILNSNRKTLKCVLLVYVLFNSLLSIPSVLNHFIDMPGMTEPGVMFINDAGYYGGRNANGMINAICLFVVFALNKLIDSKYIKYLLYLIQGFCVVNVLFSGSRSAQLGILLAFFFYFFSNVKNKKNAIIGSVGLGLSAIFILLFREKDRLFSANNLGRLLDILTSYRYSVWTEALYLVNKVNLLFGCGANSIQSNAIQYIGKTSNIVEQGAAINNCHNIMINILYNDGIIALGLFIYLIYAYIKQIFLTKKENIIPIMCVIICGMIIALLDIPLLYSSSYINIIWWLFVFYSVSEA